MKTIEALALVAGHVDEEILKRNEYLAAENEILRSKIKGRLRFSDAERVRLVPRFSDFDQLIAESWRLLGRNEEGACWWHVTDK
jgi:hypothetical protein